MSTSPAAAARSAIDEAWQEADRVACMYPELRMRVWAAPEGVHLRALLYLPGPKLTRELVVLQHAVWQPSEVTEISVVDWGRRALAKWLTEQLESSEE